MAAFIFSSFLVQLRRSTIFALQVRLQKTFGHLLNAWFGMRRCPTAHELIVFEASISGWLVRGLKNKLQGCASSRVASHTEADRIAKALLWQARTRLRVSQVAGL
jgi:hypothetical protein